MINLGTVSGDKWDGSGKVDSAALKAVITALGVTTGGTAAAAAAVASALANYANSAYEPPDPFGTATIVAGLPSGTPPSVATIQLPAKQDTYTPNWGIGWKNLPLNGNLKISVFLQDEDYVNHDDIGTAQLGYADILQALKSGQVHQIQVNKQTNNQLLFIGISVVP